jgi:hypothetical protein
MVAHNARDHGPLLFGINVAAVILAVIACLLRCYVRLRIVNAFGLDDWLMAASTVGSFGTLLAASEPCRLTAGTQATFILYCAFSITGVHYGTGRHKTDLPEESYATAMKWWFLCYLTYSATMIFAKFSIGWFLLRVTINRIHRWIIYTAAIVTCASCLCFFFVVLFQCNPISYYWDKYTQTGTCIDTQVVIALAYLYSAFSVASDFTFALLPAWVVSHLNMKKSTKAALIFLMGLGCVYVCPFFTPFLLSACELHVQ